MYESIMSGLVPCRTMTLTGQGRVTLVPDVAVIRLGVQLNGGDLTSVQAQNAMLSQAVIDALHRMGITDIRTYQYTIDKFYENINGTSVDRGFTVRNIMEIRTRDINQAGAVIDAAVNAGANAVDLISFEVSDPESHYLRALDLAVMSAVEKAKSLSLELGTPVELIPVSITETSSVPRPIQPFQRELAATPIVPGAVTVEADITAEFAY